MEAQAIAHTRAWVEKLVVGYSLCPFAAHPFREGKVRFVLCEARHWRELLEALVEELVLLARTPSTQLETTLLVHPFVLTDFAEYNDFLDRAEEALAVLGFEGVFQLASFHPDYQFADTGPESPENYSNRSPYPMLHLLREDSVARAVEAHGDPDAIPERNIRLLHELGADRLKEILDECTRPN